MATDVELHFVMTRRVGIAVKTGFLTFLRLTCLVDAFEADFVGEAIQFGFAVELFDATATSGGC